MLHLLNDAAVPVAVLFSALMVGATVIWSTPAVLEAEGLSRAQLLELARSPQAELGIRKSTFQLETADPPPQGGSAYRPDAGLMAP